MSLQDSLGEKHNELIHSCIRMSYTIVVDQPKQFPLVVILVTQVQWEEESRRLLSEIQKMSGQHGHSAFSNIYLNIPFDVLFVFNFPCTTGFLAQNTHIVAQSKWFI
uniref:Uncharacterized protein n=1 Tax=Nelumbo nucifera TaxID=4432 RepID=A0A822ZXU8_NELNU|nr:TPA_asm: hypothetical protein HUJ06_017603 [Nelumbo nucifera]